jgi:hypothetical protein
VTVTWIVLVVVCLVVIAVYLYLLPSIVLKRINRVRQAQGLGTIDKLLEGSRCYGDRCPIAESLEMNGGVQIGRLTVTFHPMRYQQYEVRAIYGVWSSWFGKSCKLRLDISTTIFVSLFDLGLYPAYRR